MSDETENNNDSASLHDLLNRRDEADTGRVTELLQDMHPADIAHLLESLHTEQRDYLWPLVPVGAEGEILLHLNDQLRAGIISKMGAEELLEAAEQLDTDDLADIIPEMPLNVTQELLLTMEAQDRDRLRSVLSYPDDTAGGLMDPDTIMVREDITLDVVQRFLRKRGEIPSGTDTLFVVDRDSQFLGVLPLTLLLIKDPGTRVSDIMDKSVEAIPAETPARDVANMFERRDLISAPVVDVEKRLLGRITIDDVVDVIRETADHSFMSMAGMNEEEDMFAPVFRSTKRRSLWLGINLLTAFLASWVIGLFDTTIQQLVALAILMPIVASMGGIAGSQTLTLVIRGMALGTVSQSNAKRLFLKEFMVGIWNGLIWATVIAGVAGLWFNSVNLALIIALAITVNLIVAAIAGATIPMLLQKIGADPALAGTVVLTTVTDVVGFFTFLGLAALFLV
ncbi:MAG: magnesium transporter [Gammaproteobacteria bacterium]|nr:magnesium transporter [Gammaproteobacteria bacterium]MDH5653655.1 magnesium transporter [Gammaproteobacteria bacterium]